MPKKHKHFSRHFKRQLHPNRWLIWAISIAVITGVALLGTIALVTEEVNLNSVIPQMVGHRVYLNYTQGYRVRYPDTWQLEKDNDGNTVFENPDDLTESITVALTKPSQESMIRRSIKPVDETDYTRGDTSIAIMKASAPKTSSELDVAIVKNSQKLFYISGHSTVFIGFVKGFQPTDSQGE